MPPEERKSGHPLGVHRVLDGEKALPQAASRLDNSLPIYSNELLIEVERLNIDAASFVQMKEETSGNAAAIGEIILSNCRDRGKQHNRVTGSGGMLIGTLRQKGSEYRGTVQAEVGDKIATLVSLTLTPLKLDRVSGVDMSTHQVGVTGHAILFESGVAARLPDDLPESVSLAAYDVCGAPAWTRALCREGHRVVVLGAGGKAGLLTCAAARETVGGKGQVIGIEPHPGAATELEATGLCDAVLRIDAVDALDVVAGVARCTHGKMGDVVVNVVSAPNTEMSSILSVRRGGDVLFFGMATSFSRAALGAEGVGSDARLIIGNGYYPGHAEYTIELVRKNRALGALFARRYQSN